MCVNGNGFPMTCKAGEEFQDGTCAATTTTTPITTPATTPYPCSTFGFFPILPDCTKYAACVPGSGGRFEPQVQTCAPGTVFNNDGSVSCVAPEELMPEEFTCPCEATQLFADPVDCKAFIVCNNGQQVGSKTCCSDKQIFDATEMKCVEETADKKCENKVNECVASSVQLTCPKNTV